MLDIRQIERLFPSVANSRDKLWSKIETLVARGVSVDDPEFPGDELTPSDGSLFTPNEKLTGELCRKFARMVAKEHFSRDYLSLLGSAVEYGEEKHNSRTGSFTKGFINRQISADLTHGIPLAGLRRHFPRVAAVELAWMLSGSPSIAFMQKHKVTFWDKFADAAGNVSAAYGERMMGPEFNNQLERSIAKLKGEPSSRQNIISFWHPGKDVTAPGDRSLVPCPIDIHWQFEKDKLSAIFHYRSSDLAVGFPVDSVRDCLFLDAMAKELGSKPGTAYWNLDDAHIYDTHLETIRTMLQDNKKSEIVAGSFPLPRLSLSEIMADPEAYVEIVKAKGQRAVQPDAKFRLEAVGAAAPAHP